jgi:hypothetical protein
MRTLKPIVSTDYSCFGRMSIIFQPELTYIKIKEVKTPILFASIGVWASLSRTTRVLVPVHTFPKPFKEWSGPASFGQRLSLRGGIHKVISMWRMGLLACCASPFPFMPLFFYLFWWKWFRRKLFYPFLSGRLCLRWRWRSNGSTLGRTSDVLKRYCLPIIHHPGFNHYETCRRMVECVNLLTVLLHGRFYRNIWS